MTQTPATRAIPALVKKASQTTKGQDIEDVIKERRSRELLIGICGAIGSVTKELQTELEAHLKTEGYEVKVIRISDLIPVIKNDPSLLTLGKGFDRYYGLQKAGNEIRSKISPDALAIEVIKEVKKKRHPHLELEKKSNSEIESDHKTTQKVAYIINQLKHPKEVSLLQTVYQRNFYLLGLISSEQSRKNYLKSAPMSPAQADQLMEFDRKDSDAHGQQVEKTLYLSDYFIRDSQNNVSYLQKAIERFIKLIHGFNGVTPTHDEVGMYTAASAALRSACLSRQVGAAVVNKFGDILSTGCNDVPVAGGGLYSAEHGDKDHRCIFKGKKCYNDYHKSLLEISFKKILEENKVGEAERIASELLKNTQAKDLIEYSRAVHAEMDALVQLARTEGQTTVGATLYCTTYPCHSCARHIVAAGISKVIYIEPYEKSLALQLHDDAITTTGEEGKVYFAPFEGVAPQRYFRFFKASDRKKDGIAVINSPSISHHIDPQYLDSSDQYEEKVIQYADQQGNPFKAV